MTRLYVIRHGMRIDHEDRSWKERATARTFDPPLSENGETQARQTAAALRDRPIVQIFCSPLLRTIQTGHPLAEALDLPLRVEGGLSEWLNPKWHDFSEGMLPLAELRPRYPRLDPAYRPLVSPRYPEIEQATCAARCEFTTRQLAASAGGDLVLFTHGACLQAIVRALTGGRGAANEQPCAINVLERTGEGDWQLLQATTEHLTQPQTDTVFI